MTQPIIPEHKPNAFVLTPVDYLDGPKSRTSEFCFTLSVVAQFIRGFRKLHFIGPTVTIFGSARFKPDNQYYQMAERTAARISKMGFAVMTGGGPGIMEAANKGAYEAGGLSIGCNIKLPHEQVGNAYMHEWVTFDYFFVRKFLLLKYSYAFIVLPGGWGTMDELFETLTLIQTGMIHHFPVVLMGKDYYAHLVEYLDFMVAQGTISKEDLNYVKITDDPEEASGFISAYVTEHYTIKQRKRFWIFGERDIRKRKRLIPSTPEQVQKPQQ